jgi:hypothetical protein
VRSKQQHSLYRDAQNDYWEARARRARRVLAARKAARATMSILIVVLILGVGAVILNGKSGRVVHRVEGLVRHADAPAIEPEQQVEDTINQAAGASVDTVTAKGIVALYQPGNGGYYMAICMDPQGVDNDASGVVSMAQIGGWDCVLVNYMSAVIGARASGGADWTSIADLEPYLAADAVTRQFAEVTGGTFIPA